MSIQQGLLPSLGIMAHRHRIGKALNEYITLIGNQNVLFLEITVLDVGTMQEIQCAHKIVDYGHNMLSREAARLDKAQEVTQICGIVFGH